MSINAHALLCLKGRKLFPPEKNKLWKMAEEDTLFGLDIVKDFILAKGGKTTNHELVTHFKSFLNNPKWKSELSRTINSKYTYYRP